MMGLLDRRGCRNQGNKVEKVLKENSFSRQHEERCKDKPVQRCELVDSQFSVSVTISIIDSSSPGAGHLLSD